MPKEERRDFLTISHGLDEDGSSSPVRHSSSLPPCSPNREISLAANRLVKEEKDISPEKMTGMAMALLEDHCCSLGLHPLISVPSTTTNVYSTSINFYFYSLDQMFTLDQMSTLSLSLLYLLERPLYLLHQPPLYLHCLPYLLHQCLLYLLHQHLLFLLHQHLLYLLHQHLLILLHQRLLSPSLHQLYSTSTLYRRPQIRRCGPPPFLDYPLLGLPPPYGPNRIW